MSPALNGIVVTQWFEHSGIYITLVQSYTGKHHKFVAVCSTSNNANGIKPGIAWYYGDHDFIIQTSDFIAQSDAVHMTCSTWYEFSRDL